MSKVSVRKAFDTWKQFTKDSIDSQLKEDITINVEDVLRRYKSIIKCDVIDSLEEIYKDNNKINGEGLSNCLIEDSINKFREGLKCLEMIYNDIQHI